MIIEDKVREMIEAVRRLLDGKGKLPSSERLLGYYALFRSRFGPSVLAGLDGDALLETMHGRSTKNNLMYWLEFKNDDEFPAIFGSIGGGSATKFGVFQRVSDGNWVTGHSTNLRTLSKDEALQIVRRQRDQLVAGCKLLDVFPQNGGDEEYARLQQDMTQLAPDVSDSAWGHKYFSLLYPEVLDDYHNETFQRFYLISILIKPWADVGRYRVAGQYIALTRELGIPMNHLTSITNEIHPKPYRYWRIGTTAGTNKVSYWDMMHERSIISIGWPEVGDLSDLKYDQESKDRLRAIVEEEYPARTENITKATQQIFNFRNAVEIDDIVLAAQGMTVFGVGRITGEYQYDEAMPFPNFRSVEWLSIGEWRMPDEGEGLQTTLYELKKVDNRLAIERRILDAPPPEPPGDDNPPKLPAQLSGWPGRIKAVLERKGQVILYGPPGTGKTFWADITARELAARSKYARAFDQLSHDEQKYVVSHLVRFCTFHPAYGYEDFLEGYRPTEVNGTMVFQLRAGIFKALCTDALAHPDVNYYLIIDEINRGDIPRIFGELITTVEKNKRGKPVLLPMSGDTFTVPPNVYVIGTMNTADRSIALVDAALRRRFGALEFMPDSTVLGSVTINGLPLGPWLDRLNNRILSFVGRDARNLQIGHSYLLDDKGKPLTDNAIFIRVLREEIIPLLEEYCYENYSTLAEILGQGLVDVKHQRIRDEFFTAGRVDDLFRALLEPNQDIIATNEAVEADQEESGSEPPEDESVDVTAGPGE